MKKQGLLLFVGVSLLSLFMTACDFLTMKTNYSDLEIETNTIGLLKIPLSESGIKSYNSWLNDQHARWQLGCGLYKEYDEEMKWREDNRRLASIILAEKSYVYVYQEIKFADKNYYLYLKKGNNIVIVNKESKKRVEKFSIGKRTYGFFAKEVMLKDKPYLVIITYSPTWRTNTSVLIILDSDFSIVYKEILTSVKYSDGGDIGSINSDMFGNCIIVKSNNEWRRWEWNEWQKINGDWVYYLP